MTRGGGGKVGNRDDDEENDEECSGRRQDPSTLELETTAVVPGPGMGVYEGSDGEPRSGKEERVGNRPDRKKKRKKSEAGAGQPGPNRRKPARPVLFDRFLTDRLRWELVRERRRFGERPETKGTLHTHSKTSTVADQRKTKEWRQDERYRPGQDIRYSDGRYAYDRYRDNNSDLYERHDREQSPGYNRCWEEQQGTYDNRPRQGYRNKKRFKQKRNVRNEDRQEPVREYQREPDKGAPTDHGQAPNRPTTGPQPGAGSKAESSNTRKAYYYYCQQEGHYSNQCPVKSYEK